MTIKEKQEYVVYSINKILENYKDYSEQEKELCNNYLNAFISNMNSVWLLNVDRITILKRINECVGLLLGCIIVNVDLNIIDIKNLLKGKTKFIDEIERLKLKKYTETLYNQIIVDMDNTTSNTTTII